MQIYSEVFSGQRTTAEQRRAALNNCTGTALELPSELLNQNL